MESQKKLDPIRKVEMWLEGNQLADYEDKAFGLGKENKTAQGKNREDIEDSSSSSGHLDAMEVSPILSATNKPKTGIRKEKRKQIRKRVKKWLAGIKKPTANEDKTLPACLDIENKNPEGKIHKHIEVSSIPTEPYEWERRKQMREEERIKRQAMRPPTTDYEDKVLFIGGENQNAQGKTQKNIEVSSFPTDPQERERREKRREKERIKRQAAKSPNNFEDDLSYYGKKYQMKFAKKAKKGYKDMRKRYPDLKKVLASLNTPVDRTYEQNPMSVTPLDQTVMTPLDQTCMTPLDQTCMPPLDQTCMMSLDQMSMTSLDQMCKTALDEMGIMSPLDQMSMTSRDKMSMKSLDQMCKTALDEMGIMTPLDQMSMTSSDKMCMTVLDEMRIMTPLDEMCMTPLDQMCNETVNTENLRFGMASSAASPGHRPLEPAEPPVPAPGPTRPEAPAHIHVRTVDEINALPRDLFVLLMTTGGPAMSDLLIVGDRDALGVTLD